MVISDIFLDVSPSTLDAVAAFVYHGTVQIAQDRVEEFLELGKLLKVGNNLRVLLELLKKEVFL